MPTNNHYPAFPPARANVLLVDDEPNNLQALQALLEGPDLDLLVATSGRQALKMLEENEVALVIMDVKMPGLDGFETATLIRGRHKTRNLPIIFLTAAMQEEHHLNQGFSLGAVDYLTKPVEPEVIVAKVHNLVDLFRKGKGLQARLDFLYGPEEVNILLVNDNPADLLAHRATLQEQLQAQVLVARTGDEALRMLLQHDFALIVLDVNMPEMDGFELATLIRQRMELKEVPIIFVTATTRASEDVLRGYAAGAADFIFTPCPPDILRAKVGALLDIVKMSRSQARQVRKIERLNSDLAANNRLLEEKNLEAEIAQAALRQNEEALHRANDELESRVSARTEELQQALHELQSLQQQLVQQERLRALGEMASGIAHDFNNVLTPILGYTELLLDNAKAREDPKDLLSLLSTINTAALDAASIVRRLREFYRKRDENEIFLAIDLGQIIEQAITLSKPKWQEQARARGVEIGIETDLTQGVTVMGNEANLREVLINLIFNAVDAMPEGGTIRIGMDDTEKATGERTDPCPQPSSSMVDLRLSDTGTGMPKEVLDRCFEPFFTTKGQEHGTGLGLAMVYGIIKRHGGSIAVESTPGQGTTFTLSLPRKGQRLVSPTASPGRAPGKSLHILLVDDEPQVLEVHSQILVRDGHQVRCACCGEEGLALFRADWFDLVITDLSMPRMNGSQFACLVKKLTPAKPIIMLTGLADSLDQVPSVIDLVLAKPVTPNDLRRAIAKVMNKHEPVVAGPEAGTTAGGL